MLNYLFILLGLVFLVKGADFLVEGGSAIAKHFKVKNLVIGLTIVAFGTSAPELVVSSLAAINGSADLAISNIVGSVVTNTLIGLGLAAVISPLKLQRGTVWKEIPFSVLAVIVVFLLANDQLIPGAGSPQLTWTDGLVLLSFFAIFMYYTFGISQAQPDDNVPERIHHLPLTKSIPYVLIGLIGLIVGGEWIVSAGTDIALQWGVSEKLIGLVLLGPATSLPELATVVIAARKKNLDMAVGGIIGSNIFNIFMIIGFSAFISGTMPYNTALNADIFIILLASVLLFFALFMGKKHHVERWQGAGFLVLYAVYLIYIFVRG